jgi:uncharacterized protein YdeI (YjbR/CyaY-like superfamily)
MRLSSQPEPIDNRLVGTTERDSATHAGLEVVEFADLEALRSWLADADVSHPAVWVRLRKARSAVPSVTFHELLEEGIAFGWSESSRHAFDEDSYLQRFGPRRGQGTTSERNLRIAARLEGEGRLTEAGRRALGR